jgi:hypothetical protein
MIAMGTTTLRHHEMHWSPQTHLGRWAAALAGVAIGGTAALAIAFTAGLEHGGGFTDHWFTSLAGVAILASAAFSVVTGSIALIRSHERSWVVWGATVLSVLVTALMLQQVAEGLGWLAG